MFLCNARIVLPDRIAESAGLLIERDRIAHVYDAGSVPPSHDDSIDLAGLTLFPGFIDVHIHGAVGVDTMEASAEGLLQVAEFLATQGVTAWLPTFVPASVSQYGQAIRSIEQAMAQTSVCENNGDHRLKSVPLGASFLKSPRFQFRKDRSQMSDIRNQTFAARLTSDF